MVKRILVVEDQELLRNVVAKALRRKGYFVVTANNGLDGLAQFRRCMPDLVLTDIMMPEKDGIELMLSIRRFNPAARILVMSGHDGNGETGVDFLGMTPRFGATDILAKPFDLDRLLEKVTNCVGGPQRYADGTPEQEQADASPQGRASA